MRASGRHHWGRAPELDLPRLAAPGGARDDASGQIVVIGEHRADVVVAGTERAEVTTDGAIEVTGGSKSVEVRCPEGSDVIVGANSGSVELARPARDARVTVGSGSVLVDHVEQLDARTGSGSFEVAECDGECRLKTGSGRIKVVQSGEADLATGSGSVEAELVDGAKVKAGSGNVDVGLVGSRASRHQGDVGFGHGERAARGPAGDAPEGAQWRRAV